MPALAYTVVHKLVTDLPAALGLGIAGVETETSVNVLAARDVAALALPLALRFGLLYPAWACLICYESDESPLAQIGGRESRAIHESVSCIRMLYMCYQKLLLRLAILHLQAAGIMVIVESLTYMVAIALLENWNGTGTYQSCTTPTSQRRRCVTPFSYDTGHVCISLNVVGPRSVPKYRRESVFSIVNRSDIAMPMSV